MNFKFSLLKVFTAFCFLALFSKSAFAGDPVIRPNWDNNMGTEVVVQGDHQSAYFCIKLGEDYLLNVGFNLFLNGAVTQQIFEASPEMRIKVNYYINNSNIPYASLLTPAFNYSDFVALKDEPYLVAKYQDHLDCLPACNSVPYHAFAPDFNIRVQYQLVTPPIWVIGGYNPYPTGLHPELWSPLFFEVPTAPNYQDPVHVEAKDICCYDAESIINIGEEGIESMNSESLVGYGITNSTFSISSNPSSQASSAFATESLASLEIMPNPFSTDLNLRFNLGVPSKVDFECLDLQGHLIKHWQNEFDNAGMYEQRLDLSSLPQGIYYLKMSNTDGTIVKKIVKTQ